MGRVLCPRENRWRHSRPERHRCRNRPRRHRPAGPPCSRDPGLLGVRGRIGATRPRLQPDRHRRWRAVSRARPRRSTGTAPEARLRGGAVPAQQG